MMRQLRLSILVSLTLALLASSLLAETNDYPLIAPDVALRYGIKRAWFTQVPLVPGREGIIDMRMHISSVSAQTFYQVKTDQDQTYSISDRDLDAFGKPLGVDGAGKAAAEKVRLLRLQGVEAKIEKAVVPDITIYVATSSGTLQAIDAETGRTFWTSSAGTMDYPTSKIAVSEDRLAVINGQGLYLLDAKDGAVVEERRIVGGPAAGSTIWKNMVFVSMYTGHLDAYTFGENAPWWCTTYRARRSVHNSPTTAGDAIVWANDVGDVSVITADKVGIRYRFRLSDPVAGSIVYSPPNQIVCVTTTGYVYSFDVTTGQLMWRYASGEPSDEPAAIVGDTVYLLTDQNGMHAISAKTGERKWPAPFPLAHQFVAATAKRVYCTTKTGYLALLDSETGQMVGQIPMNVTDRVFANNDTDRLYIATRSGALQCLHEIDADLPVIHLGEAPQEKPAAKPATEKGKEAPKAGPVDPFAKGAAEAGAPAAGANPFEKDAGGEAKKPSDKEGAADVGAPAPGANPFEKDAGGEAKKSSDKESKDPFGGK